VVMMLIAYLVCLVVLAGSGLHMLGLYRRARRRTFLWERSGEHRTDRPLPIVTVQICVCDEGAIVDETIRSVAALRYPHDRLQVQICDDSSDPATITICREAVARYSRQGIAITHLRRQPRTGFKPGNLNHAMDSAEGELIAILDADFRVPADFLTANVPRLVSDPSLACVQTHWRHDNRDRSPLHRALEGSYEVHLLLEQQTWSDEQLWMHANGSASIWRARAIEDCGRWHEGSGVEDLAMSYLAQLKGWRIRFSTATTARAQLPDSVAAYRAQQRRWAVSCGALFRALFWRIATARTSWRNRQNALIKLGSYLTHAAMGGTMLLTWPVLRWLVDHPEHDWLEPLALGLFALQVVGHGVAHAEASRRMGYDAWQRPRRALLTSLQQTGIALMVGSHFLWGILGGRLRRWQPSNAKVRRVPHFGDSVLEWGAMASTVMAVVEARRHGHVGLAAIAVTLTAGVVFLRLTALAEMFATAWSGRGVAPRRADVAEG
jgi:glycosyltransferase involved in cell wall biosynthesis